MVAIPVVLSLALGQWTGVFAQNQAVAHKPFALTIENIMRGPGLYGYEPNAVRWAGDSQRIYFTWKQASDPIDKPNDTYVVNRDGSGLRKLSEDEARLAPPTAGGGRGGPDAPQQGGSRTRDRKKMVYAADGDLFLYDFSDRYPPAAHQNRRR